MSEFEGEMPPTYASPARDKDTIRIIVIGLTGSGKSTFINLASGSDLPTSASLHSCTEVVQLAPEFSFEGRRIRFIDTPGFDDTDRSEVEILRIIKDFLENQYKAGTLLQGIIYLQRISDVRMGGVSARTLRVFRKLCGSDSLKNTVIVTNMWSKEVPEEEENRERQLRNDEKFFKPFMDDHATMIRHDNTIESANKIVRQICTNIPSALAIQRETVEQRKTLPSTSAGITLRSALLEPSQGLQALVNNLQARIKAARDEEDQGKAAELRTELWKIVPGLARFYNELKNLEALTGEEMNVMDVWDKMDPKAQIVAIFRRSCGADNNSDINAFWAALGDTIKMFNGILDFFEEHPLPLSIHDQLLHGTGILTLEASRKFDKWLSDNDQEIWDIRSKIGRLVATKAGTTSGDRSPHPTQTKGAFVKTTQKDNIITRVGASIMGRFKPSSGKQLHYRR